MQDDYAIAAVPPLTDIELASAANLFPEERTEEGFGGAAGLRGAKPFTPAEVARIDALMKERLLEAAATQSQTLVDVLTALPLARWHEVDVPYDHGALLSKRNRVLSSAATKEVLAMSAFDYLREVFGDFYLYDEDNYGQEEISFRLVRPQRREDVGYLHRDDWFWQSHNLRRPPGKHRVKLWVQVCGDPETAGLRLAPGSHRLPAPFRTIQQGNKTIFESDVDWHTIGLHRFVGPVGTPVLFNHYLLHVGSMNPGPLCRASFETTLIFN